MQLVFHWGDLSALNNLRKEHDVKRSFLLIGILCLLVPFVFWGCSGDDGTNGINGVNGADGRDLTATPNPESCSVCHGTAGDDHQASYDDLYQDNVIVVTNLAYANDGTNDTVTFNMTKAGANFDCRDADSLGIYFVEYTGTGFDNDNAARLSLKASPLSYNAGTNLCTSTVAQSAAGDLSALNGLIVLYGRDETLGTIPGSRVSQNRYPFAALSETGTVGYTSAANVSGCEKCHTVPFLKHGYIYGQVNHDAANDFYTCKACHQDSGAGGHFIWQMLVDVTPRAADLWAQAKASGGDPEDYMTPEEVATYAYTTRLMNDVHMSHAMEFEYPQSMANCATCHAGKLDSILTDANFTAETCKSCHPVTGSAQSEKPQPSLQTIWVNAGVDSFHNAGLTCNSASCHVAGAGPATFSAIHTGYDKKIYGDAAGTKYADAITVTIDNASFVDNQLTFGFSATGSLGGVSATDIAPTVLVGLYGWNTKDYLFGPHERTIDSSRNIEYVVGTTHPRFTTVSMDNGSWVVTANLSTWADNIVAGAVRRVEIAVMPKLLDADNVILALNAPSRTFDLGTNAFNDAFYDPIVKVATGCNNCHDALATTFHSADRGGNIVVCRLCHITKSGGSHLEMQSRSIDSYAHAIHSFQAFDTGDVNFGNAVESMFYDLKIEAHYPTFGNNNCVSCHVTGKFNVPDQSKSLPGVFSASDYPLTGWTRNIGTVPSYIAGPASRACGACHRAELIKEDRAVDLASFNSHTRTNGYLLEGADIETVFLQVMSNFEESIVLPAP
jgi:hypothetical protein